MSRWSRRAFLTAGVLTTGVVVFGIAVRPGNRAGKVADLIATEDESVFNVWLKIAPDNSLTVIVPHAEMGQGVHTSLAMMIADEMDADWRLVRVREAPAHKEYANYAMARGYTIGDTEFPDFLVNTVNGFYLTATKLINMQITGGSLSVATTGQLGMRVAGQRQRRC